MLWAVYVIFTATYGLSVGERAFLYSEGREPLEVIMMGMEMREGRRCAGKRKFGGELEGGRVFGGR